jgi:hypothetical protein
MRGEQRVDELQLYGVVVRRRQEQDSLEQVVKSAPPGSQNSTFLSRPKKQTSTPFNMQQI